MSKTPKTSTEAEFARHRKVSRKTVCVWKSRGYVALTADGRVDVAESDRRLNDRPATYRGGKASRPSASIVEDATMISLIEAQRRKEVAIAKRRELDYEVAAGRLIDAAAAESIVRSDYATVRTRLLGLPSKLAMRLAATRTPEEADALLHREMVKALDTLSREADNALKKMEH